MSHRILTLSAIAGAVLAISVSAQTHYIPDPDASPSSACQVAPFGLPIPSPLSDQRYQLRAHVSQLGNPTAPITITNVGFAPCELGLHIQHHDSITVTLAQMDGSPLSPTFDNNLQANAVVVLQASDYQWHLQGGQWNRIGLDRSYVFDPALGENLVIELKLTGSKKVVTAGFGGVLFGSGERVVATGATQTTGFVHPVGGIKWCVDVDAWSTSEHGVACEGLDLTMSGSAQIGQTLSASLGGAANSGLCAMAVGMARLSSGIDLPGTTACRAYIQPTVVEPAASFSGTVPNLSSAIGLRLYFQFYCVDNSYPGGAATSDYGVATIGVAQ